MQHTDSELFHSQRQINASPLGSTLGHQHVKSSAYFMAVKSTTFPATDESNLGKLKVQSYLPAQPGMDCWAQSVSQSGWFSHSAECRHSDSGLRWQVGKSHHLSQHFPRIWRLLNKNQSQVNQGSGEFARLSDFSLIFGLFRLSFGATCASYHCFSTMDSDTLHY